MTCTVILTAAGTGTRLGHALPKALVPLDGAPLVAHAARRLAAAPSVDRLVVTAPAGYVDDVRKAVERHLGRNIPVLVVPGGASRQESVARGLAAIDLDGTTADEVVLVHDAARCLAPTALVERVVAAVEAGHPGVIPVLAVTDTIKRVAADGPDGAAVLATVPRGDLRRVQTPQGFRRDVLLAAHTAQSALARDEETAATDDAALLELAGHTVWAVAGDELAMKITTRRDLAVAAVLTEEGA